MLKKLTFEINSYPKTLNEEIIKKIKERTIMIRESEVRGNPEHTVNTTVANTSDL